MGVVFFTKVRGLAKSESPRTLRVLGLSNFTCPWTFAKTTTPINFSQYCTNAPNNARRWRLVRCTTIPNGTEFSVSLPGHAMLLPCHPAVFCALQEVL